MILVELGNDRPTGATGPAVFRWVADSDELSVDEAFSAITGEPIHERHTVLGPGAWRDQSDSHNAAWVNGNTPELNQRLAEFYHCPVGVPDDVEDTHWTFNGPPGVGPKAAPVEESESE